MGKQRRTNGVVRPIRTRRDFEGASHVAKRLADQAERDSAAEARLQALLRELDRFDEVEEDPQAEDEDYDYAGPRRRWSDESNDG
jgi:hypothetical protein